MVLGRTNLVMVAIMAVAPVHLMAHGNDLGFVGLAVSVHVLAMFAPSPVTGRLADRLGPAPVAAAGAVLLILAGSLVGVVILTGARRRTWRRRHGAEC